MGLKFKKISGSGKLSADGLTFTDASALTITTDKEIKTPRYYFEMTFFSENYKHLTFDVYSASANRAIGIFGIEVDHTKKTITYYLNGNYQKKETYTANTIPQVKFYINEGGINTVNFGEKPFKYPSTSGFRNPASVTEKNIIKHGDKYYSINGSKLTASLEINLDHFLDYGMDTIDNLDVVLASKEYLLQNKKSIKEDELTKLILDKKPLSICININ